jgi:bifunctional oligoribonuclease and PAP phosphatase NrnA
MNRQMMNHNPLKQIKPHHSISLVTHIHPDGDAYGSVLGLYHLLKEQVKKIEPHIEFSEKSKYDFLPGFSSLKSQIDAETPRYDFCVVLDCGNAERTGSLSALMTSAKKVINIDHHISNTLFGDLQWIEHDKSSTSEIIAALAQDSGLHMSADAATCLLTGIMMDTGGFLYENTTASTHYQASRLIDAGADQERIRSELYQNRPLQNVKFLAYMIEHMELIMDHQAVLIAVPDALLNEYQVAYEDLDEYIAYARDIEGIELAVIVKELNKEEIKISFRSKSWLDVNELASHFNGGGHARAAGAVMEGSVSDAIERLKPVINHYFDGSNSE